MELNKLCIILPADYHQKPKIEPEKSSRKRICGGQIIALIKSSLSELSESKWVRFCRHERAAAARGSFYDTDGTELTDKVGSDNPRIFSYSELYIGTRGFSEEELLGSGGFGRVFKATLPSDGSLVAVKCLAERGERFERTFAAELVAVAHLRHRNLVRLRGWCVNDGRLLLVYDYMPNRSLDRILFRRPEKGSPPFLGWDRRWRIVAGLAAALFYLHEQLETQIVHRDVKASNVMLDSNYDARLGDFGLARWLEHGGLRGGDGSVSSSSAASSSVGLDQFRLAETSKIGGTIGYLPPESFRLKGAAATAKSDVFSFGIVVLEVVSGRRAVDLTRPDDRIVLLDWVRRLSDDGKLSSATDRTLGAAAAPAEAERLLHLALLCTLHDPNSRPSMKWVAGALSTGGGGLAGKFPPLPLFRSHPKYISLSSSSSSTAATTVTAGSETVSSFYVTANEDTIYSTAENSRDPEGPGLRGGGSIRRCGGTVFPMVHTPREISYDEIVAATGDFSDANRVAEVDFGTAYRGVLAGGHHVLVKRLGMKTCPALRDRFSAELQSLGRLRHRHLVQLRGWCTDRGEMLVVYDHGAGRRRQLSSAVRSGLTWRERYGVVRSLASAVHYLHEEWDETVVHRSITSSAVVLDQDSGPRLGSFALAEFLTRNEHGNHHITTTVSGGSVRGIFGYMSPEYVDSGEATTAADVYSFGVVVLEVVTGEAAVDFRRPEVLLVRRVRDFLGRRRAVDELADIRLGGEFDRRELERLMRVGTRCTGSHPESRPTMREIVRILDGNDEWFMGQGQNRESVPQWNQMNGSSLSLIKRIQALGIQ